VVLEGWPYLFTRSQIRRLRRAGYRFDAKDLQEARRLWIVGFTAAELVGAVEDLKRYVAGDRAHLESIAKGSKIQPPSYVVRITGDVKIFEATGAPGP